MSSVSFKINLKNFSNLLTLEFDSVSVIASHEVFNPPPPPSFTKTPPSFNPKSVAPPAPPGMAKKQQVPRPPATPGLVKKKSKF